MTEKQRMLAGTGWPFDPDRPRTDHGLFGPDSPTWRVWTNPTALIAFQRSIVVETFDPFLTAAVADSNAVRYDLAGRLDSTLAYFTIVAIGDSRAAIEASELLMRVHSKATGVEPITGRRYSANNPDSQLWIHVTGWQSNLRCYELFGPGRLSAEDEDRYWADCVRAAELQTCDPASVPRNRDEVREYYAEMRPKLCVSERAAGLIDHFLRPPHNPKDLTFWPGTRALSRAAVASIPRWMRRLGGFDQPAALDAAAVPVGRAAVRAATPLRARMLAADRFAPSLRPIWQQALAGPPPLRDTTVTPSEAKELYGSMGSRAPRHAADAEADAKAV